MFLTFRSRYRSRFTSALKSSSFILSGMICDVKSTILANQALKQKCYIHSTRKPLRETSDPMAEAELNFTCITDDRMFMTMLGKDVLNEKNQKLRRRSHYIVLEGVRLIRDALSAGAQAKCLSFCDEKALEQLRECQKQLENVRLYRISPDAMKVLSDTVTPAGLLGVFKKPKDGQAPSPSADPLPITLVLDSIKDPGNAGTLIRTAAAVGCQQIVATKGSVNLWERKVLRSAMGAHFHIPIISGVNWEDLGNLMAGKTQVLLADSGEPKNRNNTKAQDFTSIERTSKATDLKESNNLNTFKSGLPTYDYSKVPVPTNSLRNKDKLSHCAVKIALVIGSEATGLSSAAETFAVNHSGCYVRIPMNETTNSLNSGIAGSIILYELRRRLLEHCYVDEMECPME